MALWRQSLLLRGGLSSPLRPTHATSFWRGFGVFGSRRYAHAVIPEHNDPDWKQYVYEDPENYYNYRGKYADSMPELVDFTPNDHRAQSYDTHDIGQTTSHALTHLLVYLGLFVTLFVFTYRQYIIDLRYEQRYAVIMKDKEEHKKKEAEIA